MSITIPQAKNKADRLHARMLALGIQGSYAQALELLASAFGDETWAAMRARLNLSAGEAVSPSGPAVDPVPRVFTMVANPVAHEGGRFTHDLRAIVLARSEGEAARRLQSLLVAQGRPAAARIVCEDNQPLNADETMPNLSLFGLHLSGQFTRKAAALHEAFWEFVSVHAPHDALLGHRPRGRDAISDALFQVAKAFRGPKPMFEALYAALDAHDFEPYASLGSYGFFSKSRTQGIRWALA